MTYLNVSRNNRLIFLMDHNFLGLGKMSTTYENTLSKDSNLRKKKSAVDHRKIYLYKVKDFIVWPAFVLSLLSLLEFPNVLKERYKYIIKQNQSPQPENSKITEKLSRELSPVRISARKRMHVPSHRRPKLQPWDDHLAATVTWHDEIFIAPRVPSYSGVPGEAQCKTEARLPSWFSTVVCQGECGRGNGVFSLGLFLWTLKTSKWTTR